MSCEAGGGGRGRGLPRKRFEKKRYCMCNDHANISMHPNSPTTEAKSAVESRNFMLVNETAATDFPSFFTYTWEFIEIYFKFNGNCTSK
jgi:hypothetical protein